MCQLITSKVRIIFEKSQLCQLFSANLITYLSKWKYSLQTIKMGKKSHFAKVSNYYIEFPNSEKCKCKVYN